MENHDEKKFLLVYNAARAVSEIKLDVARIKERISEMLDSLSNLEKTLSAFEFNAKVAYDEDKKLVETEM